MCEEGETYTDDDGRHESPAHLEEERRREAQHHLHVLEVVPVTCQVTNTHQVNSSLLLLIVILRRTRLGFTKVHTFTCSKRVLGVQCSFSNTVFRPIFTLFAV